MNTPLIEIALCEVYGERCREPEPGCPCCNTWHELDTLKVLDEQKETKLGPAYPAPETDAFVRKWQNADPSRALAELTGLHRGKERELAEAKAWISELEKHKVELMEFAKQATCDCYIPFGKSDWDECKRCQVIKAAMAAQH